MCTHHPIREQYLYNIEERENLFKEWEGHKKQEERKEFVAIMAKGFVVEYVIPEYMPFKEIVSGTVFSLLMVIWVRKIILRKISSA